MPRSRVLIIDDEVALATILRRYLVQDHVVELAFSGQEALRKLDVDGSFDVIFCDLLMPEVTGMDVYDEVRRVHPGLEHRIIFMTGGAFTPRAREFLDSVPNQCIEKPLDLKHVRALLRSSVYSASPS